MSEEKKEDMIPDKQAYQVNRRRMCWVVLAMLLIITIAILGWPERYEKTSVLEMAYLALSGLVAAYFGATAFQNAKLGSKR